MHDAATVRDVSASEEVSCICGESQNELLIAGRDRSRRQPGLREEPAHQKDRARDRVVRRILLPTDFSPASARAVERAMAIANQCNAELTILHVVDINAQAAPGESGIAEDLMQRRWGEGSEQMGQLALSLCGQVEARTMIEQGLAWETIVEKSRDFDLVILGQNSGRSGRKLFSQHTGQRVIANAACPVMVVPDSL
jgi:nucleotide-binding universal stress UspA family protein